MGDDVFARFGSEKLQVLKENVELLLEKRCGVTALKIKRCNAADGFGVPFTKAYCHAEVDKSRFLVHSFGTIFWQGLEMLTHFLEDPAWKPVYNNMELPLTKLIGFILDIEESGKALLSFREQDEKTEADWTARLAEHYLSKLSFASSYTIDKHRRCKVDTCLCGCNADLKPHYGSTGIGSPSGTTWHGHIDLLLGDHDLSVKVNMNTHSPEEQNSDEEDDEESLHDPTFEHQILAQTISFSFLHRKLNPECENNLVPCIGVSKNSLIFYFYDTNLDILLKTPTFPLFDPFWGDGKRLSIYTVLATWFVVNYKYLCSGVSDEMNNEISRAEFLLQSCDQLDEYREKLKIFEISKVASKRKSPFEPWQSPCTFKTAKPF